MLKIFLSLLNILFGVVASSETAVGATSSSSILIVQPSASGRGTHRFNPNMPKPSIPSGAGGQGAKEGKAGDGITDKVGKMVEETQEQEHRQQQGMASGEKERFESNEDEEGEGEEEDEEGDEEEEEPSETVLREPTAEETPNPKKRMWEEPVEEGGHDEL